MSGRELLLAALQVWLTNMIAFALVYWELDRGGAVARLPSSDLPEGRADFVFPQDDPVTAELALGVADERWIPVFIDYLYMSITNSTAFSPTDTLPLTTRAKALMSFESLAAMITTLLAIARAVNILKWLLDPTRIEQGAGQLGRLLAEGLRPDPRLDVDVDLLVDSGVADARPDLGEVALVGGVVRAGFKIGVRPDGRPFVAGHG